MDKATPSANFVAFLNRSFALHQRVQAAVQSEPVGRHCIRPDTLGADRQD
jgi:hypothetical protein